jgi:hypothetical protein
MAALTTNLTSTSSIESTGSYCSNSTVQEIKMEDRPLRNVLLVLDRTRFCYFEKLNFIDAFLAIDFNTTDSGESIFLGQSLLGMGINSSHIDVLESFRILPDGWDGDDAVRPSIQVLEEAISFTKYLQSVGEKVYHVAPGPNGEIMIELRDGENAIEFLVYPSKFKYVLLTPERTSQGLYDPTLLPKLLETLHA